MMGCQQRRDTPILAIEGEGPEMQVPVIDNKAIRAGLPGSQVKKGWRERKVFNH